MSRRTRTDKEPHFRKFWCNLFNKKANKTRKILHAGPELKMYKEFARKLVDDKEWFLIPLYSGMQNPLSDAIDYLASISDYDSIPRLRILLEKYMSGASEKKQEHQWGGYRVTVSYGPRDYISQSIQNHIVQALLQLLPINDAKEFVKEVFSRFDVRSMAHQTIETLTNFAIKNEMHEAFPLLQKHGITLKNFFDTQWRIFISRREGGVSYDHLYAYETLINGAYQLTKDSAEKEETLKILIEEYNNPDADRGNGIDQRPHDFIDFIICRIIDSDITHHEKALITSRLNQTRLQKDMESYKRISKVRAITKHRIQTKGAE